MRVMIVVTHLLGVGHLARASALGRALVRAGHDVTLVRGGGPAPNVPMDGLAVVQLPAVHARGADFKTLYDSQGAVAGADLFGERARILCDVARDVQPDAVIIELFPFGRRQLKSEFMALLDVLRAQANPPVMFSSVRDVLAPPSTNKKADETVAVLGQYFDHVLVHGDASILSMEASWPVPPDLARRLIYTGYVREPGSVQAAHGGTDGAGEVVVSGGGSGAGLPVFRAALGAAALMPQLRWRILVGHGVGDVEFADLQVDAPPNAVVERARRDFAALLGRAACSISLAGYNTMLDLAAARVPAVVVPFDEGQEVEQTIRAGKFREMGLLDVVSTAELTPAALVGAVERAIERGVPVGPWLAMEGATRSAGIVVEAVAERAARAAGWARVRSALDAMADEGRILDIWWRDDDAVAPSPALDRLLALAAAIGAPLALAVIPGRVEAALAERLAREPLVTVLVHGMAHRNNAAPGAKKQELVEASAATLSGLAQGREHLARLFGAQSLPVLVPPWNRIAPDIVQQLSGLGFAGLSTFAGDQRTQAGLHIIDTHLDPIDWKGGGGAVCASAHIHLLADLIEARRSGHGQILGPIGLLTHHLVHDAWIWRLLEHVLRGLAMHRAVRFVSAKASFALTDDAVDARKDK